MCACGNEISSRANAECKRAGLPSRCAACLTLLFWQMQDEVRAEPKGALADLVALVAMLSKPVKVKYRPRRIVCEEIRRAA